MSDDLIKRSDALSVAGDMSYIAFEIRRKIRMIPSAEPMPDYIDNILVVRHYCNGMVAMNEECYKRLQTRDEPMKGTWEEKETFCVADDDPIISQWQSARCSECGKYHTTPYMYYFDNYNFCPHCGAKMSNASNASNTLETLEKGETE